MALKILTHLALKRAALHIGKEETALEEVAVAGSACTLLWGGLPRLTGVAYRAGLCHQALLAMGHPQGTGSSQGDTHRLLRVKFLQDKKAKRRDLRGTGHLGRGGLGRGWAVLTIMLMMVSMVSSTSTSRVGFRLVAVKLRR